MKDHAVLLAGLFSLMPAKNAAGPYRLVPVASTLRWFSLVVPKKYTPIKTAPPARHQTHGLRAVEPKLIVESSRDKDVCTKGFVVSQTRFDAASGAISRGRRVAAGRAGLRGV